jgi:hypothetical protein
MGGLSIPGRWNWDSLFSVLALPYFLLMEPGWLGRLPLPNIPNTYENLNT